MQNEHQCAAVEELIREHLLPPDDKLTAALTRSAEAGLPSIQVSPNQGKFLQLLLEMINAERVLEIGTLGGYSTIWMARALPRDGRLISLEYEPRHAEVARENIQDAGLSAVVEVRVGAALDLLPQLVGDAAAPFDLVFIDADKQNTAAYFDWAVKLTRPGGVIVVDNVVREGAVLDADSSDASVRGVRRFYEQARNDFRVSMTALQTVGGKGYDGFALARVLPDSVQDRRPA